MFRRQCWRKIYNAEWPSVGPTFWGNAAPTLYLFVLFVWSFSSHSRVFHSFGDVTITGKRLQILTYMYARHLWPLSSEDSLACHIYYDTGHPFIMVISQDPWHSQPLPSVGQWSSGADTSCFNDLGLLRLRFEHPTFRSNHAHDCGANFVMSSCIRYANIKPTWCGDPIVIWLYVQIVFQTKRSCFLG